ncbi:MAG: hypothetical protein GX591_20640, partial [Planctomycetes bacterium]|nr:hypothetical protein [Planctomycetota bacterium]
LTDDAGAVTLHAWSLKIVDADPGAPVFDMAWPQTVVVPGAILLPVTAYDPDGGTVTISVDTAGGYALPEEAVFDAETGMLFWEPGFADIGTPHTFSFVAVDDDDPPCRTTFSFAMTPVLYRSNVAPQIDPPQYRDAVAGDCFSIDLTAADLDDPEWLTWTVEGDAVPAGIGIVRTGPRTALLQWVPGPADLGEHTVTLRVTDAAGAADTLEIPLKVLETPPVPTLPAVALKDAVLGAEWSCTMHATDLAGDVEYDLVAGPGWMTMSDNVVHGIPQAVGPVQFTVRATCQGRWSQRVFQLTVLAEPPLRWEANPDFYAVCGSRYARTFAAVVPPDATASDTFIEAVIPAGVEGMTFAFDETARVFTVDWLNPKMADHGKRVTVGLRNGLGIDMMEFVLRVAEADSEPVVDVPDVIHHPAGIPLMLDLAPYVVWDQDFLALEVTGLPGGAVFSPSDLTLRWSSPSAGSHVGTFSVSDLWDQVGADSFTLDVFEDVAPPTLDPAYVSGGGQMTWTGGTGITVPPGTEVTVHAEADDDVAMGHIILSLQTGSAPQPLQRSVDADGDYRFRLGNEAVTITIAAFDLAGNPAAPLVFTVAPETHGTALPTVALNEALRHCTLTEGFVQFQATFTDPDPGDPVDVVYTLELIALDVPGAAPVLAASGTAAASPDPQPVGSALDVARTPNGRYLLRVVATHGADTVWDETELVIDHGTLDPGNLDLTFTDLSIQAKLPIEITRRYSLADAVSGRVGAFGPGWECNYERRCVTVTGLAGAAADAAFTGATGVAIALPDGGTFRFTFAPAFPSDGGQARPAFTQQGAVAATLTVADAEIVDIGGAWARTGPSMQAYNPAGEGFGGYYELRINTTVYRFDASTGQLVSIADGQGNQLTCTRRRVGSVGQTTITSSGEGSAVAVLIEYDAAGRIRRITDPAGNAIRYAYDPATGDLAAVTNRSDARVAFAYDDQSGAPAHRLATIQDPRQVAVLTAAYDAQGALVSLTDADGFATSVTTTGATTTSTEAGDGRTLVVRDVRGNVLRALQLVDEAADRYILTQYAYDDQDRLTAESVPMLVSDLDAILDGTKNADIEAHLVWQTVTEYNSDGSVATATDALGNRTVYRYHNGALVEMVDPAGRRTTYRHDDQGRLFETKDASGTVTRYTYDSAGNLRTTLRVLRRTGRDDQEIIAATYTYDLQDRLIAQTDAAGRTTWYGYDAMGNQVLSYFHVDDAYCFTPLYPGHAPDGDHEPDTSLVTVSEYDGEGRRTRTAEYAYFNNGQLFVPGTLLEQPHATLLWETATEYDSLGNVSRETDRYGTETAMTYDRMGRMVETRVLARDTSGAEPHDCLIITRTAYDARGRVLAETDAFAVLASDVTTRVLPANPADLAVKINLYDTLGNCVGTRRLPGVTIILADNPDGTVTARVVDVDDPDTPRGADDLATMPAVEIEQTHYDYESGIEFRPAGRVQYTVTSSGARTDYYYDDAGRQVAVLGPLVYAVGHDGMVRLLTEYAYDATGRNTRTRTGIAVTPPQGDPHPDIADPALRDETGLQGTWFEEVDDDGRGGRFTRTVYADGTSTSCLYDSLGRLAQKTGQDGQSTFYRYDDAGRLTAVILPAVRLCWEDPYEQGTVHYDGLFHPRYEYDYDAFGNLTAVRTGIVQSSPTGDEWAWPRSDVKETSLTYDAWGRQLTRTLPEGQTDTSAFDRLGRVVRTVDFEGRITEYAYDDAPGAGGRLAAKASRLSETDPVVLTVEYHYDALGRQTRITETHWDTTPETILTTTTAYDARGRVTSISSPQGVVSYEYAYLTGRQGRTTTSEGNTLLYPADTLNRITMVWSQRASSVPSAMSTYAYDLMGNLAETRTLGATITQYRYDSLNRLREMVHLRWDDTPDDLSNNPVLARFSYTLDDAGRRVAAVETRLDDDGVTRTTTFHWTYDNAGRLVEEVCHGFDDVGTPLRYRDSYVYDAVGNRMEFTHDEGDDGSVEKTIAYAYDDNDRLLSETVTGQVAQEVVYDYDNGQSTQLLGKTVTQDGVVVYAAVYTYDVRGRMDSATVDADGAGPQEPVVSLYTYNDDGIRTSETIVGGSERTFLIDPYNTTGHAQVLEVKTDGVHTRSFRLGLDVLAEYAIEGDNITPVLLLADGHGSTRLLSDFSGTIQAHYAYSAYGLELPVDTAPPAQPALWTTDLRFSGEWTDADTTGLQYLRERYFDCAAGRFVSTDPWAGSMREPQSLHKYLYCHGDPVNHVDPSGFVTLPGVAGAALLHAGLAVRALGLTVSAYGLVKFAISAVNYGIATVSLALGPAAAYDLMYWTGKRDAALQGMFEGAVTVGVGYGLYVVGGAMVAAAAYWQASPQGLAQNPMYREALRPYNNGLFTNAGRALTKHPNIVGAQNAQELTRRFGNQQGINEAAANALKNIMRNGAPATKMTKSYGLVVDYRLPNGLGARFSAETNEFIGFLGRGL